MRRLVSLLALLGVVLVTLTTTLSGTPATAAPAAPATTSAERAAAPATRLVYVRPVTESGVPAPGWSVYFSKGEVDCFGSSQSAVNPGIAGCYPTAYSFIGCYKSVRHTVLCVRDATVKKLVRIKYTGSYPTGVDAPARPTPANTVLSDGRTCKVRTGGGGGSPKSHPDWVEFSYCTSKASTVGSGNGNGIDDRNPAWSVRVWLLGSDPEGRDLVTRRVVKAYVIGIAAG